MRAYANISGSVVVLFIGFGDVYIADSQRYTSVSPHPKSLFSLVTLKVKIQTIKRKSDLLLIRVCKLSHETGMK